MELVNYLRIVRRRWRLVAVFLIAGVALGVASGAIAGGSVKGPGPTYYLAKHTLSSSDGSANLSRDAALCTEGEVPKRVASKLGLDNPNAIAGRIICEPHPETNLLYVAAADSDSKRSVLLADSFAEQLVSYLRDVGEQLKQTKIDTFNKQIDALKTDLAKVQADEQATSDSVQKKQLQSREADLQKKINDLSDQKNAALAAPAATETLTTLSTAEALPISQGGYDALINTDPKAAGAKGGSPTQNATRQSQIDAAIKSGNALTLPTRAAMGAAFGLLLGFALAIVLDRVDPRIRTKFEAEEAFGWPVIGEIPPLTRRERQQLTVFAYDEPRSRSAEAYRVLRSAVLFSQAAEHPENDVHPIFAARPAGEDHLDDAEVFEGPAVGAARSRDLADPAGGPRGGSGSDKPRGQVIMVTSPGPSEGKTTTAANLAAILAETGRSVIVVNCDFRRPRIHLHLDAPNEPRQVVDTKVANVKLVSQVLENANDANPAMVLQTQRQVVRNAREMFDIVLLDTAPLLTTNDATDVLSVADQVVIVVKAGKTHKEAADRAAELLERRKGPVLGVILVGATDVPTSRYYYYGDTPETEEPLPGTETSNPLEALLDDERTREAPRPATPDARDQRVFSEVPGTTTVDVKTVESLTLDTKTVDATAADAPVGDTRTLDTATIDTKTLEPGGAEATPAPAAPASATTTFDMTAVDTTALAAEVADARLDPASTEDRGGAPAPAGGDNGNGKGNGKGNGSRRSRRSGRSGGSPGTSPGR